MFRAHLSRWKRRLLSIRESLRFDPGALSGQQFVRFVYYHELSTWLPQYLRKYASSERPKVIEFGGSNGVIKSFLGSVDYIVAPNWPTVDIQKLEHYGSASFDCVVLDQVLEHVPDPIAAVSEIYRVLRPKGVCVSTTPFLIKIHGCPGDFWRFTDQGLRELFKSFSSVEVSGWGNRFSLEVTSKYGWIDCRTTKRLFLVALWNEPDWPIVYWTKAIK